MSSWFQRPLRLPKVPHSMEDMSHNFKTTSKFGLLTPIGIEECVPSDECKEYRPCAFLRLSPLLYPIMHRVHVRMHTFEVPFRLILGDELYQKWLNGEFDLPDVYIQWEKNGEAHSEDEYNALSKYDMITTLGYPRFTYNDYISAVVYPNLLYQMDNGLDYLSLLIIWREWYADSDIDAAQIQVIDNIIEDYRRQLWPNRSNFVSYVVLQYDAVPVNLYCRMQQDYFTTARPAPQYGDPINLTSSPTKFTFSKDASSNRSGFYSNAGPAGAPVFIKDGNDGSSELTLDLTIRELWRREQIQRYFDVTNTFGSRIREWIAGHMGVIFPDDRLMIPRLLQTVQKDVTISEVIQTSETSDGSPLGAYAGKGTLAVAGPKLKRFFVEHSLLITVLSVRPESGYAQSRPRYQFKKSIFDFALPEFNNIGYQEIYKGEIFGESINPKGVFGYTMRYSEYRDHPNRCSNGFKDDPTLIDFHLNRFFTTDPGLNPAFISADQSQFYRIFTDENADMDSFLIDAAIVNKMWRPVSVQPSSMHL